MRRFLVLLKMDLDRCTAGEETSTTADDITEINNFIDAKRCQCGGFPWFSCLETRVNETAVQLLDCLPFECPSASEACLNDQSSICFPGNPALCTDSNGTVCNSINCKGEQMCCENFFI